MLSGNTLVLQAHLMVILLILLSADNVYGVLPITAVKKASVWMMIFHQFIAWSLYVDPLLYM